MFQNLLLPAVKVISHGIHTVTLQIVMCHINVICTMSITFTPSCAWGTFFRCEEPWCFQLLDCHPNMIHMSRLKFLFRSDETLLYPQYSPDITPCDYDLFTKMNELLWGIYLKPYDLSEPLTDMDMLTVYDSFHRYGRGW